MARRLGCDASIVTALERGGTMLSLGRKVRTVNALLRRALYMRDKTCMFPGCNCRYQTEAHHLEHWVDGGETSLENLLRLCRFHHKLVHEGGFDVRRTPRGGVRFYDPKGRVIPQAPRQPRGDCTSVVRANRMRGVSADPAALYPRDPNPRADLNYAAEWLVELRDRAKQPPDAS